MSTMWFLRILTATIVIMPLLTASSSSSSSSSSIEEEMEDILGKPKNVILMVADGLGANQIAAYRLWKELDSTILDDHLRGLYSVYGNGQSVADSAATATALGSGVLPPNERVGIDDEMNPIANILEASKLKGKGVGVVTTVEVTHGTPAAFTAKSVMRFWEDLIAYQQTTRVNGEVDILFGGGREYFDGTSNGGEWNLYDNYEEYGWGSVPQTRAELDALSASDLPSLGLFSKGFPPNYMLRKNFPGLVGDVPGLLDLSKKALALLAEEYEEDGFFMVIEAGMTDYGNHFNDLAWVMNELDEYLITLEYIINEFIPARDDFDTLVVMVSDHESGGFSLGRASQWDATKLVNGLESLTTFDDGTVEAQSLYSFDFDPLIPVPLERSADLASTSMYQFLVEPLDYPTMPALIVGGQISATDPSDDTALAVMYATIEATYIETLTSAEKAFLKTCLSRVGGYYGLSMADCLGKILSVRVNAGWTTHGHTANDIRISAYGPEAYQFLGFNGNIENIGKKLIEVLDVADEMEDVNAQLKESFLSGLLELCDGTEPLGFPGFDVGDSIAWEVGNYKYPGYCVEEFV